MVVLLAVLIFVLVALCVVLYAFHRTRPSLVRIKARLARWLTFDLEIRK